MATDPPETCIYPGCERPTAPPHPQGGPRPAFRYRDWGQLATIGRKAAVAVIGRVKLSGFIAWFVWLVAHIYFLINFRNRVVVMFDLAGAYWTFQRYARIIIRNLA